MALRFGAFKVPADTSQQGRPRAATVPSNHVDSIPKTNCWGQPLSIPAAAPPEDAPQLSTSLKMRFDAPSFVMPSFAPQPAAQPTAELQSTQPKVEPAVAAPKPNPKPQVAEEAAAEQPKPPAQEPSVNDTGPPTPAVPAAAPKISSWAAMASKGIPQQQQPQPGPEQPAEKDATDLPAAQGLPRAAPGDSWSTPAARGMVNPKNDCFMNAVLQAVVSCDQIAQVLATTTVPASTNGQPSCLAAAQAFVWAYASNAEKKALDSQATQPMLKAFRPQSAGHSAQEDAQEFFSFLLNQVHDELTSSGSAANSSGQQDQDDWYEVGAKNQSSIMRQARDQDQESALSQVASGVLRSALKSSGLSSASRERLFMVPLDVSDDVCSIEQAVDQLMLPELIDGVHRSGAGGDQHGVGKKHTELDRLPEVLMLHLKRFVFTSNRAQKVSTHVSFGQHFEFESRHLSRALQLSLGGDANVNYELQAVISHHGAKLSGGHYTCDARRGAHWHRFDDRQVTPITLKDVLDNQAYMLMYVRVN